jgi:hypothetical protein
MASSVVGFRFHIEIYRRFNPNISSERGKADLRGKAEKGLALKHSKG